MERHNEGKEKTTQTIGRDMDNIKYKTITCEDMDTKQKCPHSTRYRMEFWNSTDNDGKFEWENGIKYQLLATFNTLPCVQKCHILGITYITHHAW